MPTYVSSKPVSKQVKVAAIKKADTASTEMIEDVNQIVTTLLPYATAQISVFQTVSVSDANYKNYSYIYGLLTKIATYRETLFGTSLYESFLETVAARNPGGIQEAGTIGSFLWGCMTDVTGIALGCSATCASSLPPPGATRENGGLCSQMVIAAVWKNSAYDIIALNSNVQTSPVFIVASNTYGFSQKEIDLLVAGSPTDARFTLYTYDGTTYKITQYQNVTAAQLPRRDAVAPSSNVGAILLIGGLLILILAALGGAAYMGLFK